MFNLVRVSDIVVEYSGVLLYSRCFGNSGVGVGKALKAFGECEGNM